MRLTEEGREVKTVGIGPVLVENLWLTGRIEKKADY